MPTRSPIDQDGILAQWPSWPSAAVLRAIRDSDLDAAGEILWGNADSLDAPAENALRVLAAVRGAVARHRLAGEAAEPFLSLSESLFDGDEASLRIVGSDPRAYFWTRIAQQLVAACRFGSALSETALRACEAWGESDPGRALAHHLSAFEPLVRGLAHPPDLIARHRGCSLPVSPRPWDLPGFAAGLPVLRAGAAFHEANLGLVTRTLEAIERFAPESFEALRRRIRFIGLIPPDPGRVDDWSDPELPGSFIARAIPNPLELADHFIHELQHNRLSFAEECGSLFDAVFGDAVRDARHFSPWRDKPRALYGIFHGVYVFVAVGRYWLRVHGAADLPPEAHAYAVDRLLRIPRQLALALGVLRRGARFAPFGRILFERLTLDVGDLSERIERAGLPADAPALAVDERGDYVAETGPLHGRPLGVRESLLDHLRRNDPDRRCAGLVPDLAW
ncbi:MAG TPA: HEXXH motif-containing putative peptide modification protein [Myxococcota bacterium]